MVWFQCEDCGENLKKPKLPNHFRMCSAYKLSCIDCGEMFTQQTIQSHMQCMTEAEKYGPKNQAKPAQNALSKISKPKPVPDVDINVGLSTRPPWFCSLCNTTTTSKQTLLLHADGKKHRNKAKAFHASQNPSANPEGSSGNPRMDSSDQKGSDNFKDVKQEECLPEKKRKANASDQTESKDFADGEVIQSNELGEKDKKRAKNGAELAHVDYGEDANGLGDKDSAYQKISWKKLIISILKSNPDGVLKIKKLQKQVTKSLQASGTAQPKEQLQTKLMDKITSSSRFIIDGKYIHLAKKIKSS